MKLVLDTQDLPEIVDYCCKQGVFVFDVETRGPDRINARKGILTWLSITSGDHDWVIPMGHINGSLLNVTPTLNSAGIERKAKHMKRHGRGLLYEEYNPATNYKVDDTRVFGDPPPQLSRTQVFEGLRPLFFSDALKIGHNVKYDLHSVAQQYGEYPEPPYYDTLVAAWLQQPNRKGKQLSLKTLVEDLLGKPVEKGVGENIDLYSFEEVAEYSAQDSRVTWDLYVFLESRFTQRRARALRDLEMSVLEPVLEMEAEGTRIDVPRLTEIGDVLRTDTDVAHRNAVREAGPIEGKPFNIGSNPQKQQVLYGKRRLKPTKLTPGGKKRAKKGEALSISDYSVDAEALADLGHDTLVQHIQTYQSKSKLLSTYIDPYLGEESRLEGNRIHTSFNQTGAESGRFSSSGPNLQNIPNRSEDGRRLREVFVSDEGETLVVADYSQIEPRIIASLAGDKTMTDTYYDGGDVYQVVADRLSVSRPVGKELVLSIAYGVGPAKISARTGLGVLEARELLHFFAQEFSAVPKHKAAVINKARRMKYAETVLGRRRSLPAFRSRSRDEVSKAERQAYNHRIQGSAADVMKMALVGIYDSLPPEARLLMTVHDEVVVSAPEDMADEVGDIVKKQMEAVDLFTVPLVAEVGSGHRWSEAH